MKRVFPNSFEGKLAVFQRLLAGHWRLAIVLFFLMLAVALSESLGLALVMPLVSTIAGTEPASGILGQFAGRLPDLLPLEDNLIAILLLLSGAFLIKGVLAVISRGLTVYFSLRLRRDWALRLYEHYLTARYPVLAAQKTGIVIHNVASEPYRASKAIVLLMDFANQIVMVFVLTIVMLMADWRATLLIGAVAAIIFLMIRRGTYLASVKFGKRRLRLMQEASAQVSDSFAGALQVKLFDLYRSLRERLDRRLSRLAVIETQFFMLAEIPLQSTELVVIAIVSGVILFLRPGMDGDLAGFVPMAGFFIIAGQRLMSNTNRLITKRMKIASFIPSLLLIDDHLKNTPEREALNQGAELGAIDADIVFQDVSFSHANGTKVFDGLTLPLPKGRVTAIVGPSGSGKSTLANLLLGLLLPTSGDIRVGGVPLSDYSLASLRRHIGYVSQESWMFNGTVHDNIACGRPDSTDEEIMEAARRANAHEFIQALPDGYGTEVGERGAQLSGGQKQRLAIARVILRRPGLFIFDEATSALDHESEKLIQESIDSLAGEATVVIIAHRLTTVQNADAIYALDREGKARQTSYAELAS